MKLEKARSLFENLFLEDFQILNIVPECFKFTYENKDCILFYSFQLDGIKKVMEVKVLSDKRIYILVKKGLSNFYIRVSTNKDFKYVLIALFSEFLTLDEKLL